MYIEKTVLIHFQLKINLILTKQVNLMRSLCFKGSTPLSEVCNTNKIYYTVNNKHSLI